MKPCRNDLPQASNKLFLTDGGLETTLIFDKGLDLPEFAAFDLFKYADGYETLRDYYRPYVDLALKSQAGFILESPTWRASRAWGAKIGYTPADLKEINHTAIAMLKDIRKRRQTGQSQMVISGCIGPRGDGYNIEDKLTAEAARHYHYEQIRTLKDAGVDLVSAFTINYTDEAVGITRAAAQAGVPVVISFTVETDGRLPSGEGLGEAITSVDQATDKGPAYYMINCAHPSRFQGTLNADGSWLRRIQGVRANASAKSHAELDEAEELDPGDPIDLGARYAELRRLLPNLNIFGGCCGTDHRHMAHICNEVVDQAA